MSYCVNCGVELAPSEKSCPLCGVEVVNPAEPWREPRERPYPLRVERMEKHVDRRFFGLLATLLLQVPLWICIINDLLVNRSITWSLYVVGAGVLVFVTALLPLVLKRPKAVPLILLDALTALGFLLMIDWMTGKVTWFIELALPITLAFSILAELFAIWMVMKKHRPVLISMGLISIGAGVFTMCVELILNNFHGVPLMPSWSWYTLVPCILVGIMFIVMNSRNRWRENIRRRLFF